MNPLHWISRDYGRTKEPLPEPEPKPFPITLEGMVAELEREFASNPHWTGKGRVTRPIVLMARIVSELAVRAK